jgi:hypothetical protein
MARYFDDTIAKRDLHDACNAFDPKAYPAK